MYLQQVLNTEARVARPDTRVLSDCSRTVTVMRVLANKARPLVTRPVGWMVAGVIPGISHASHPSQMAFDSDQPSL